MILGLVLLTTFTFGLPKTSLLLLKVILGIDLLLVKEGEEPTALSFL